MSISGVHQQLNTGLEKLADGERFAASTRGKIDNGDALAGMLDRIGEVLQFYRSFKDVAKELTGDLGFAAGQYSEAAEIVSGAVEGISTDAADQARVGTSDVAEIVSEILTSATQLRESIDNALQAAESLNRYAREASRLVVEMAVGTGFYEEYHPAIVEAIQDVIDQTD